MLSHLFMTDRHWMRLLLAMTASAMLASVGPASADPDEAWLMRAPLPTGVRPLLIIVLDTSAEMAGRMMIAEAYDPLSDYAAASGATRQCDPQRIYWRRGPGPAPGLPTEPDADEQLPVLVVETASE